MKVGFIGIGTMGASMALNVRAKGYDLIVNDIRREAAAPHLKAGATMVSATKGLETETLRRLSEVIAEEVGPAHPVVALSGPSFARRA